MDDDNENGFDIPDLRIDALAEQNDQVQELVDERDEYRETVTEVREELDLAEDECPCDAVTDLATEHDELESELDSVREALDLGDDADVASHVEDIADEWTEYRDEQREEALDELEALGADPEAFEDSTLEDIETEIERREEVVDAIDATSPTGVDANTDGDEDNTDRGNRQFGRGHAAAAEE